MLCGGRESFAGPGPWQLSIFGGFVSPCNRRDSWAASGAIESGGRRCIDLSSHPERVGARNSGGVNTRKRRSNCSLDKLGQEGKGNVKINFGDACKTDGVPNLGRKLGNSITINYDAVDAVKSDFKLNASDPDSEDARPSATTPG